MARRGKYHSMKPSVDVKTGLISREIFVSEDLYQQELRSWDDRALNGRQQGRNKGVATRHGGQRSA